VQLPEPVYKFPEFVGYLVRRLKTLCPTLGKKRIAQTLARAGLHLGTTTVGRMLNSSPSPFIGENQGGGRTRKPRLVTANRPNHVWHINLTVVPTSGGCWAAWSPFALPQCWPFGWWVAVIVDHFSRRVMGVAAFYRQPASAAVCALLGRTMRNAKVVPKYLICDRGPQFDGHGFRCWHQGAQFLGSTSGQSWERLFHNLRASRQTELANEFPLHVVTDWIGNSPEIADRHDLKTTDDHFKKAASGQSAHTTRKAAQNPAQQAAASDEFELQTLYDLSVDDAALLAFAISCENYTNEQIPPRGVEPRFSG
jgi:hypothetical protein